MPEEENIENIDEQNTGDDTTTEDISGETSVEDTKYETKTTEQIAEEEAQKEAEKSKALPTDPDIEKRRRLLYRDGKVIVDRDSPYGYQINSFEESLTNEDPLMVNTPLDQIIVKNKDGSYTGLKDIYYVPYQDLTPEQFMVYYQRQILKRGGKYVAARIDKKKAGVPIQGIKANVDPNDPTRALSMQSIPWTTYLTPMHPKEGGPRKVVITGQRGKQLDAEEEDIMRKDLRGYFEWLKQQDPNAVLVEGDATGVDQAATEIFLEVNGLSKNDALNSGRLIEKEGYFNKEIKNAEIEKWKNHPQYKAMKKSTRDKLEKLEEGTEMVYGKQVPKTYGLIGGPLRNFDMLTEPDVTEVVYWHKDLPDSMGTKDAISIAHRLKHPVYKAGQQEQDFEANPNPTIYDPFIFMKRPLLRPPNVTTEAYETALELKNKDDKPIYTQIQNKKYTDWKEYFGKYLFRVRDFEKYDDWADNQGKLKEEIVKSWAQFNPDNFERGAEGQLTYRGTRDIFGLDKNNDRTIAFNEMIDHMAMLSNTVSEVDKPIGIMEGTPSLAARGYKRFKNGDGPISDYDRYVGIMPEDERKEFIEEISDTEASKPLHGGLGTQTSAKSKDELAKIFARTKLVGSPPKVYSDRTDVFDNREVIAKMKTAGRLGEYYDPVQAMRGENPIRKLNSEDKQFLRDYVKSIEQMWVIPDSRKSHPGEPLPVTKQNIKNFYENHPAFAVADEAVILPPKLGGLLVTHQDDIPNEYYGKIDGYHLRPQHHILARQHLTKKVLDIMADPPQVKDGVSESPEDMEKRWADAGVDRLHFNMELQETDSFRDGTLKYGTLDTMNKEIKSVESITPTRYRLFLEQSQIFDDEVKKYAIEQYGSVDKMREIGTNQKPYKAPHWKYTGTMYSGTDEGYDKYEKMIRNYFPEGTNFKKDLKINEKANVLGAGKSYHENKPGFTHNDIERKYEEFKKASPYGPSLRKTIADARENEQIRQDDKDHGYEEKSFKRYEIDQIYKNLKLEGEQPRYRVFVGPKVRAVSGMHPDTTTEENINPNLKYQFMRANASGTKLTSIFTQYIPSGVVGWIRDPLSEKSREDKKAMPGPTHGVDTTGTLSNRQSEIRDRIAAGEKIEDIKGETKVTLTPERAALFHTDPKKREEQEQALKDIEERKTPAEIAREVHYQDGKTLSKEQTQEYMKELKSKREPFSEDTDKGVHDQPHFFRNLIEAAQSVGYDPSSEEWVSYADIAMKLSTNPKFDKTIYKKLNEDINYYKQRGWKGWMDDTSNPPHTTLNSYKDIVDNMPPNNNNNNNERNSGNGAAGGPPPETPPGNEQVKNLLREAQRKLYEKYNFEGSDIVSWMEKDKRINKFMSPEEMREVAVSIQTDGNNDERFELIQKFGLGKDAGGYFEEFSFQRYGGLEAIASGRSQMDSEKYLDKIGDFDDIMREYGTSLELRRKLVGKTDIDNKIIDKDKASKMSRDWFNMCYETGMPVEESIKDLCIDNNQHVNALNAQLKDEDKIKFIIPDASAQVGRATKFKVMPKEPPTGHRQEEAVRKIGSTIGGGIKSFIKGGYKSEAEFNAAKLEKKKELTSQIDELQKLHDADKTTADVKKLYASQILALVREKQEVEKQTYSRKEALGGRFGKKDDEKEWKDRGKGFNIQFGGGGNRGGTGISEVRDSLRQFSNENKYHNTVGGGIHGDSSMSMGGDRSYGEAGQQEKKGIASAVAPKPTQASEEEQQYRARLTGGPGLGADIAGRLREKQDIEAQAPSRGERFLEQRGTTPAGIKYIDTKPQEEMKTFGLSGSLGLGETAQEVDPVTGEIKQKRRSLSKGDLLGRQKQKGQGVSAAISGEMQSRNPSVNMMQDESKPHVTHSTNIFKPIRPQKQQTTNTNNTNPNDTMPRKKRAFGMGLFS